MRAIEEKKSQVSKLTVDNEVGIIHRLSMYHVMSTAGRGNPSNSALETPIQPATYIDW